VVSLGARWFSVRKQPGNLRSSVTEENRPSVTGKQSVGMCQWTRPLAPGCGTSVGVAMTSKSYSIVGASACIAGILAQFCGHFLRQAGGREENRDCVDSAVLCDRSPDILGEFARGLLAVLVVGSVRGSKN
jgi:hypothetical protein